MLVYLKYNQFIMGDIKEYGILMNYRCWMPACLILKIL